jgi:hypothetical protein
METGNRDAKTAGPIATRMREMIMPQVFDRFYEKATGWLYDFYPGTLPVTQGVDARIRQVRLSGAAGRADQVEQGRLSRSDRAGQVEQGRLSRSDRAGQAEQVRSSRPG